MCKVSGCEDGCSTPRPSSLHVRTYPLAVFHSTPWPCSTPPNPRPTPDGFSRPPSLLARPAGLSRSPSPPPSRSPLPACQVARPCSPSAPARPGHLPEQPPSGAHSPSQPSPGPSPPPPPPPPPPPRARPASVSSSSPGSATRAVAVGQKAASTSRPQQGHRCVRPSRSLGRGEPTTKGEGKADNLRSPPPPPPPFARPRPQAGAMAVRPSSRDLCRRLPAAFAGPRPRDRPPTRPSSTMRRPRAPAPAEEEEAGGA